MLKQRDVIIAGGGLSGLVAAIHLSRAGLDVTLFEKQPFPQHKVCGEYVSNEVIPYLQWLDADPAVLKPTAINKFQFSSLSGKLVTAKLPLGGFGISRYAFDQFLLEKAVQNGCTVIQDKVTDISDDNGRLKVRTASHGEFQARIVIGAYGKRTIIDHQLNRTFIQHKSPWLAVKAHYTGSFDDDLVALHQFKGGYCGASRIENNQINICYLTNYQSFKNFKNLDDFQEQVLFKNQRLKSLLQDCTITTAVPLSISQISFENKETVKNNVLMIGDAAGLIHPLCGNGMAMAIHSAKLCAELIIEHFTHKPFNRLQLNADYSQHWKRHFNQRMAMGRFFSAVLQRETVSSLMIAAMMKFPFILPQLIKRTHGKPLTTGYVY